MRGDQFWKDIIALVSIMVILRVGAFIVLKAKMKSVR